MADKGRKTFPVGIDFGVGEQPSGSKISAVATQARNGLAIIEFATGDLWGQSGDSILTGNPLQLSNLARMIGENKLLNPAVYPTFADFSYTENLLNSWTDYDTGYLQFSPKGAITIEDNSGALFTTLKTYEHEVDASGDYWIDTITGKFKVFGGIQGTQQVSYTVGATDEWLAMETLPGVIPDPKETTFSGLKFEESGGVWHISLPPRGPLTFSDSREMPVIYPPATEYSDNYAATAAASPKKLWQDPTLSAFVGDDAIHYRYALPREISNATAWLAIDTGARLPDGFLYLWDQTNETVVEGVIFYKAETNPTYSYRLKIEIGTLDTTGLATADETSVSYNSGYSLITSGASLARLLWQQQIQFLGHKHDNSGDLSPTIRHRDLTELNPPDVEWTGNLHEDNYPDYGHIWPSSRWAMDDHTSLLSRLGAQTNSNWIRDPYNNAMLGHLLMANADVSDSQNFVDNTLPDESFKIYFGDVTGPYINATSAGNIFVSPNVISDGEFYYDVNKSFTTTYSPVHFRQVASPHTDGFWQDFTYSGLRSFAFGTTGTDNIVVMPISVPHNPGKVYEITVPYNVTTTVGSPSDTWTVTLEFTQLDITTQVFTVNTTNSDVIGSVGNKSITITPNWVVASGVNYSVAMKANTGTGDAPNFTPLGVDVTVQDSTVRPYPGAR